MANYVSYLGGPTTPLGDEQFHYSWIVGHKRSFIVFVKEDLSRGMYSELQVTLTPHSLLYIGSAWYTSARPEKPTKHVAIV